MGNLKKASVILMTTVLFFAFQQDVKSQTNNDEYVYIAISGKVFSKKLRVVLDFGDEAGQIRKAEEYREILSNKTSFIAILNYMTSKGYELTESLNLIYLYQGTGGTSGLGFIMRKIDE